MSAIIVIPSRYASSRFPGKPLALIRGKPMIQRVWECAKAANGVSEVIIATDDDRIEDCASGFGAKVTRTSPECRNGSERVFEVAKGMAVRPDVIVNLQGDSPVTPPWILEKLIELMVSRKEINVGTPAVRVKMEQYKEIIASLSAPVSGTYVVCDQTGKALYFSRFPIPFLRHDSRIPDPFPVLKHIGIYAYRYEALAHFTTLKPTPLEELEQLEQLRLLENGVPIHVTEVDIRGRTLGSVDVPNDIALVEKIIEIEGELL